MAWNDPIVWILIVAVVIFLFGANKIPQLARAIGQARKEFSDASKSLTSDLNPEAANTRPAVNPTVGQQVSSTTNTASSADPLIVAAQNEGIETQGKTREQIASELAWKLSKK